MKFSRIFYSPNTPPQYEGWYLSKQTREDLELTIQDIDCVDTLQVESFSTDWWYWNGIWYGNLPCRSPAMFQDRFWVGIDAESLLLQEAENEEARGG